MTKNKIQDKTEEQKKFEEMQNLQMQVLQSNSFFIGANSLKNSYGTEGSEIADSFMNSESVFKVKQQMFEQEKKEAEELGIAYSPELPTNYELIKNSKKMTNGAMQTLTFGNLEKIAKNTLPGFKVDVVNAFKNKTYMDIHKELEKVKGDVNRLDEKSKDALQYHTILSQAYEKGNALALMQNSYLSQYNEIGKQLSEKYKPKEKSKDKK